MKVVTRFAPSPTGYFHAGSYRTALFSCIYARQNLGKFILRIEDTDKERSKKEYEENIIESLKWLGLEYDEFYRQSDRIPIYKKYIKKLIESGHAYISSIADEEKRQLGKEKVQLQSEKRGPITSVIRFKNPNKKVIFEDMIRGKIEFDTTELGNFVIAKNEDEPIFHLVVVIDDHEMGVTHIIRGEDHISNTPRQILIFEALGVQIPRYAHIPLLLSGDRSKLSKRNGAIPVSDYRSKGYLSQAVVNYLTLLGWHPKDNKELFTMEEILKEFSLDRVQKSGAIFDEEKLKWFNHQYITKLSDEDFIEQARAYLPEWILIKSDIFKKLIPILKDKIITFSEITDVLSSNGELGFIHRLAEYVEDSLLWKKNPDRAITIKHLTEIINILNKIEDDQFIASNIKSSLWSYAEANGKGDVLWPLRMALTGQEKSPDPFVSAEILGKHESIIRIKSGLNKLAK